MVISVIVSANFFDLRAAMKYLPRIFLSIFKPSSAMASEARQYGHIPWMIINEVIEMDA